MTRMLTAVRKKRDDDLSHKKKIEIDLLKSGRLTQVGFAGAQLMGMSAGANYNTPQTADGGQRYAS